MNVIDNGIKKILKIERIIKEKELYFRVTFIDLYNSKKTKNVMSIKNIEKLTWYE